MLLSNIKIGQKIKKKPSILTWKKVKKSLTKEEAKKECVKVPLPTRINSGIITGACRPTHGAYKLRMIWKTEKNAYDLYISRIIRGVIPERI